ncbi:hypothetical protein [Alteromonas facilis]|uniref:hypothetical protein n=1 Tax=Alteromonas facilis TaxID=2048004 RepID=UPI000C28594A|nr:hypothetical protein [Alteromonas facilis]
MASEFFVNNGIVQIRLFDDVDAFDLMEVHQSTSFLELVREYKHVLYDYSGANVITLTESDARSFAKLATIESQITPELVIGVIPKDDAHKKGSEFYRELAVAGGARVVIVDSVYAFLAAL